MTAWHVEKLLDKVDKLEVELSDANEKGENLHAKYRETCAERDRLRDELAEARKGLDDFVERCDALVDERERLRDELEDTKEYWRNDMGIRDYEIGRLRKALEEIANPDYEWGISAIAIYQTMQKIARDALAGGQGEQESRCPHCNAVHDPGGPCERVLCDHIWSQAVGGEVEAPKACISCGKAEYK